MVTYDYLGNEISEAKAVAVSTTSLEVSVPKNRKMVYVRNTSTAGQVISLVLSNTQDAVANTGIVLSVGEFFSDSDSEGYKCWTGSIRAISSAINGAISIMEK